MPLLGEIAGSARPTQALCALNACPLTASAPRRRSWTRRASAGCAAGAAARRALYGVILAVGVLVGRSHS